MKNLGYLFAAFLICWSCGTQIQSNADAKNLATERAALAPAISHASNSSDVSEAVNSASYFGTFVYPEQEPDESHRLVIPGDGSRQTPVYYGSESNSGEGIHFYAAPILDMEIDAAGNLSFTIGERQLYAEPVTDLNKKPKSDSGFSREKLHYKGRFVAEGIELNCTSETGLCWEDKMLFKRQ